MFKAAGKVNGTRLLAVYHLYSEDQGGADIGAELNLLAAKKLGKGLSAGIKYADYKAETGYSSATGQDKDAKKTWLWLATKF